MEKPVDRKPERGKAKKERDKLKKEEENKGD